jgi:hypothetical protein
MRSHHMAQQVRGRGGGGEECDGERARLWLRPRGERAGRLRPAGESIVRKKLFFLQMSAIVKEHKIRMDEPQISDHRSVSSYTMGAT